MVAIVGYTNAGKSTLLNRLTKAEVLVEDRLFATLDATTRRLQLPGGESVLATDTVGFVRKLPHQLVQAFTSTLDVVAEGDLLVHVVDGSSLRPRRQHRRRARGARPRSAPPRCPSSSRSTRPTSSTTRRGWLPPIRDRSASRPGPVRVSTTSCARSADRLRALTDVVEAAAIPYDRGDLVASVHRDGEVLVEQADEGGLRLRRAPRRRHGDAAPRVRGAHSVTTRDAHVDATATSGFVPPPYPYDRLDGLRARAEQVPGGCVDLSVGTPTDPPAPGGGRGARRVGRRARLPRSAGSGTCSVGGGGVDPRPLRCRGAVHGGGGVCGDQGARRRSAPSAAPAPTRLATRSCIPR
ncbi:MAG: GTPase [Acidimicrobiia bacterium]|nr:GTPase [Acidimicrobiia bacterium]